MRSRIASALLGTWLTVSVFVFPHLGGQGFNDLSVGLVLALSGLCGIWIRSLRYFDAVLGVWTIFSALTFASNSTWLSLHDLALGVAVVVLAGIPGRDVEGRLDHWVAAFDRDPALVHAPVRVLRGPP